MESGSEVGPASASILWVVAENGLIHLSDSAGCPLSARDVLDEGGAFALSYSRDFRALHGFTHDHDCTSTCIKFIPFGFRAAAETSLDEGNAFVCEISWSM